METTSPFKPFLLTALFIGLLGPCLAQAQYDYTTNADRTSITITGYTGPGGAVTIPSNIDNLIVTGIGDSAFSDWYSLTSITIPTSVTSIGEVAFWGCTSLTNVIIGSGDIGYAAFGDCTALTCITIPTSVTSIGEYAFFGCCDLIAIRVSTGNPAYSSMNGVLFDKNQTTLVEYPGGLDGSYTIPNSVTSIEEVAFFDCTNLTGVTIGSSVTNIGGGAFMYCIGLTSVMIPSSVTNIGDEAFVGCASLTGIFFTGNAPNADSTVFANDDSNPVVYYLPSTTGWSSPFAGVPAVLWNPQLQASGASFGVQSNQFGFDITGTTNIPIVVEASDNLTSPVWTPLQSLTLTNGSFHFSDLQWTNFPVRYYRIRSP